VKISLNWLQDLVAWDCEADELAARLTMAGLNVEAVEEYQVALPGVVVGRVVEHGPHPNADRLSVCRVDDGTGEPLQVVCGAPNVRADLTVLLARIGTRLPNGLEIKKAKIRGVESHGMICSAREVGLGDDADGIVELETPDPPGTSADRLYGYRDTVFDLEVTPNRPDWLSFLGVAREVAALFGTKVQLPPAWTPQRGDGGGVKVEIESFADCPRYTAHVLRGVGIAPAPTMIQNRLRAIGARPLNNVVDITNYVMFETGQPLHAFDLAMIAGERIVVRRVGRSQDVVALDGVMRRLEADDLVIADAQQPVAIAGVMGLQNSEVTETTTDLVLESAFFAPGAVRRTSRRLDLVSESSYRFEREADWEAVTYAARRAVQLLQEHAGAGKAVDWTDRYDPDRKRADAVPLRIAQVNRVLGAEIGLEEAVERLTAYGLKVQPMGNPVERGGQAPNLMVEAPSFRRDLHEEVDLIEEIARSHGYDRIDRPERFRGGAGGAVRIDVERTRRLRQHLVSRGYFETVTSSFLNVAAFDRLGLSAEDPRRRVLSVRNPHHGGDVALRTLLGPSLLRVVRRNLNADCPVPLRLFQIDRVYRPDLATRGKFRRAEEERLPGEPTLLQLAVAGWEEPGTGGVPADLLELKGLLAELSALLRVELRLEAVDLEPYLAPGAQWRIVGPGAETIGAAGRIAPAVAERFEIEQAVAVAELAFAPLLSGARTWDYRPYARYPAVKRDLSLVVPEGVAYRDVETAVREAGGPFLESVELFDLYRGKGVPAGFAAFGIRLKFRSQKGNLKGKTVDRAIADVATTLQRDLGVRVRS
jgi:phenylalanyl-tRNA synthetase beta chain